MTRPKHRPGPHKPRPPGRRLSPEYVRNRRILLAQVDTGLRTDHCGLCNHPGARTCDHIVSDHHWPRDAAGRLLPGLDALANLQLAHGTQGMINNRCTVCGKLCNQSKGRGRAPAAAPRPQTRDW